MSCITCVFTPGKIVVSEDSAVSSDTRTYTGVEKTIILSHDPPMTISCYGNSDFDDMPLENIISEYIKKTDFKKVDRIDKVKEDLIEYVHRVMPEQSIEEFLNKRLILFKKQISKLDKNELKYYSLIKYEKRTLAIFEKINENLNNLFLSSLKEELSGIVIIGIDKETMTNGYTKFEMLFNGKNKVIICNEEEELNLKKTELKVFAQSDVIIGFFNGIDETLVSEISEEIEYYSRISLKILLTNLKNKTELSKNDIENISNEIEFINENSIIKEDFNFIVQEFSGLFKPGMNCTF